MSQPLKWHNNSLQSLESLDKNLNLTKEWIEKVLMTKILINYNQNRVSTEWENDWQFKKGHLNILRQIDLDCSRPGMAKVQPAGLMRSA
jgi:hypothetical protein